MLCACACLSWVNAVPRKVLWLSTGVVLVRVLRSRDTLLCSLCVLFAAKLMRSVPSAPVHNDQKDPVPVLHVIRCLIVGPPRQPFPCVACLAGRKGTQSYDYERSRLPITQAKLLHIRHRFLMHCTTRLFVDRCSKLYGVQRTQTAQVSLLAYHSVTP